MTPAIERFLAKITVADTTGCWEWTACKDRYGYGRLGVNGKLALSHRFIYEYYHGTICPDLTIDHLCRNRKCVNPLHLEQVSIRINTLRGTGPSAINSQKTHCKYGHEFTKENTYRQPSKKSYRICKICKKQLGKKWFSNNKETANRYRRKHYSLNKIKINKKAAGVRAEKKLISL